MVQWTDELTDRLVSNHQNRAPSNEEIHSWVLQAVDLALAAFILAAVLLQIPPR